MALIKSIDTPFGIPSTYHNISDMAINWKEQYVIMTVCSYASKDAYAQGMQPITKTIFSSAAQRSADEESRIVGEFILSPQRNVVEDAYAYLKIQQEFEGAVDDL